MNPTQDQLKSEKEKPEGRKLSVKQADYFRLSSDPLRMWSEAAHKSAKKVEAKFVKTTSKEETKPGAKIKQVVEVFGDFITPSQELAQNCPNPQFYLDS